MNTLEAKVREILMLIVGEHDSFKSIDEATTAILALIEGEVRAERERCAKVATFEPTIGGNSELGCCRYSAEMIATAIRSSGEGK